MNNISDTRRLERLSHGVYMLPDPFEDEFVNIQSRYKKGIFSLDTALFLCELTDRAPFAFHMAFPDTYNLSDPKRDGIICRGCKDSLYSLGVTELLTPWGNMVRSYCAERTLCDIIKTMSHMASWAVEKAFQRYILNKERNIPLLSECARALRVEEEVKQHLVSAH